MMLNFELRFLMIVYCISISQPKYFNGFFVLLFSDLFLGRTVEHDEIGKVANKVSLDQRNR